MAVSNNDIAITLTLKEIQKFKRDAAAGTVSIEQMEKATKKLGVAAKETGGGHSSHLGIMQATMAQAKYAAAGFVLSIGAGVTAVARLGLGATSQLENVKVGFTNILKSKSAATQLVKDLQKFSDWSPFVDTDVNKWAQSLVGLGAKAQQVIPTLTAIGDAVTAMGRGPEDVTGTLTAIEQIAAKGALQSDELLQLTEHMVFARDILQKGLGLNSAQFQKALETRRISSSVAIPMILKGLEDRNKGSLLAQSQTIGGLWSTIKAGFMRSITADPDSPFAVAVRNWLRRLVQDMPAIQGWIRGWFVRIWDLGGAVKGVADRISAAVSAAVGSLSAAGASGGAFGVGQAIGGTVPGGADSLFDQIDKWASSVDWFDVGKTAGGKAIGFTFGFVSGLMDVSAWAGFLQHHWWDTLLIVISLVPVGKILGVAAKVLSKIPILKAFAPWLETAGEGMVKAGGPIWRMLRGLGGAVFRAFEREFPKGGAIARHIGEKIYDAVKVTIPNLFRSLRKGFGPTIAGWLEEGFAFGFRQLTRLGRWLAKEIFPTFGVSWAVALGAAFLTAFDKVRSGAAGLFGWLKDGFTSAVNWLVDLLNGVLSVNIMGQRIGPNIGHVGGPPKAARGLTTTTAGQVEVGDAGREILSLPRGASVIPVQRVQTAAQSTDGGGVPAFNLFIDSRQIRYALERRQDTATARA